MAVSKYVIQKAIGTSCPTCRRTADLLCDRDMKIRKPSFYICWTCQTVAQVGVGLVEGQ